MIDTNKSVQIFGKFYSIDEILCICEEKILSEFVEKWEQDIYSFIQEWYSDSETIVVKTSGSTGTPKEIKLTRKHMIVSAKATLSYFGLRRGDSIWLTLPCAFIAGKMMVVRSLVGGLDMYYSEPGILPLNSLNQKISFAAMVPNQVTKTLDQENGCKLLENVSKLLIGGSPINSELISRLNKYPQIAAWHSYGMTETITHIALRNLSKDNFIGDFYPLNGIKVSLGENNRLVIDYPDIEVYGLQTNDLVKIWQDGSFTVLGREDDVIISGGIKYIPETIEHKMEHLFSNEILIGSTPDDVLGEKITLFIESEDENITLSEVKELLVGECTKFETPRRIVFIKEFQRTQTGKIKRKETIARYLIDGS
jgi:o-succinylbenzoate---CoA ligase